MFPYAYTLCTGQRTGNNIGIGIYVIFVVVVGTAKLYRSREPQKPVKNDPIWKKRNKNNIPVEHNFSFIQF